MLSAALSDCGVAQLLHLCCHFTRLTIPPCLTPPARPAANDFASYMDAQDEVDKLYQDQVGAASSRPVPQCPLVNA